MNADFKKTPKFFTSSFNLVLPAIIRGEPALFSKISNHGFHGSRLSNENGFDHFENKSRVKCKKRFNPFFNPKPSALDDRLKTSKL